MLTLLDVIEKAANTASATVTPAGIREGHARVDAKTHNKIMPWMTGRTPQKRKAKKAAGLLGLCKGAGMYGSSSGLDTFGRISEQGMKGLEGQRQTLGGTLGAIVNSRNSQPTPTPATPASTVAPRGQSWASASGSGTTPYRPEQRARTWGGWAGGVLDSAKDWAFESQKARSQDDQTFDRYVSGGNSEQAKQIYPERYRKWYEQQPQALGERRSNVPGVIEEDPRTRSTSAGAGGESASRRRYDAYNDRINSMSAVENAKSLGISGLHAGVEIGATALSGGANLGMKALRYGGATGAAVGAESAAGAANPDGPGLWSRMGYVLDPRNIAHGKQDQFDTVFYRQLGTSQDASNFQNSVQRGNYGPASSAYPNLWREWWKRNPGQAPAEFKPGPAPQPRPQIHHPSSRTSYSQPSSAPGWKAQS